MKEKSYKTIEKVLVTEKAYEQAAEKNTYIFSVNLKADKADIANAVEDIYGTKVERVRTSILRGKVKRTRSGLAKRPNRKKAYVTVAKGQTLPVYEEI